MKRKLSVGDTLNEVFSIYGSHAGVLLPVAFWLFLAVAIVNGIAGSHLVFFPLVIVVSTIAGTLYQGMVVGLVRDVQDGKRDSSVTDLFDYAVPVILPLIGAGLLAGLGIGVGLILLIVPGLFLLTIWAVIAPTIVIEHQGVFDSFKRSRDLVRGNGWPVFGAIVVAFLIAFIGSAIFGAIAAGIADGWALRIVFSALASTITAPIGALVAGVLYYRLLAIGGPAAAPGPGGAAADPGPVPAPEDQLPPPASPGPPPPPAPPAP